MFIGISVSGRSNDYIVTDILSILRTLGLIEYELVTHTDDGDVKTRYRITKVNN